MYLRASDNNSADTVLELFVDAVLQFGIPSRVRGDRRYENTGVASYMIAHSQRGPSRSSFIADNSVQNQSVERLWRDVYSRLCNNLVILGITTLCLVSIICLLFSCGSLVCPMHVEEAQIC